MKIKCPQCDFENEEGSKFCSNCNIPIIKPEASDFKEYPYSKRQNMHTYFTKTIALYNKGEYEEALKGLEKLSEVNDNLKISLIPHIEKCKNIKSKMLTNIERGHLENQAILKRFRWIDKIKYFTGAISFVFYALLSGDPEEGITFLDNFSEHPEYLVWAIVLAILTYLIHVFMRKFTISAGLIRCKYCGKYIQYINPNEPTYGFMHTNNCGECNRMYPVPDFYWDSWEGLEYIENRHSVLEGIFYTEYKTLKKKFSREYNIWKKENK